MSVFSKYITVAVLFLCLGSVICFAQQENAPGKEMDYDEAAAKQVEEFIDRYKLDDYQAFRIDTLLQHYVPIYNEELKKVRAAGASQVESYQRVVDYWSDFLDTQYQSIFTEEQWKLYMKSPAGKEKKKRDKRLANRSAQTDGL